MNERKMPAASEHEEIGVYLADVIGLIEEVLSSGADFSLAPRGTSMLPLLRQGKDSVVLTRREPKEKDIAFYRRDDGAFVLHRIRKIEDDGTFVFCGDNQTWTEPGIRRDQIIAVVGGIERGGKKVKMDGIRYRSYVAVHSVMPIRKTEFFIRRVGSKIKRIFKKKG